jgi:transcriptional regulator with XRE-family HTH domain
MNDHGSPMGSRAVLGLNLQLARAALALTQDELARRCGLKRSYVGALERGEINLGVDNVDRLAAGLGVPPHVLLLNPDLAQPIVRATRAPAPELRRLSGP